MKREQAPAGENLHAPATTRAVQSIPQAIAGRSDLLLAMLTATVLTVVWGLLTWRYGLDIADEGFYWYGAQRMLHGELPMRDFMAYDIGRYAWSAAVMWLLGDDGLASARAASALFQVCTIPVGVWLALQTVDPRSAASAKLVVVAVVTVLLNLWVHPYYKVFDYGTSLMIVAMLVLMLDVQTVRRWLLAGFILGLAAIMGRNHGVYGAFAAFLLLIFLIFKKEPQNLGRPSMAFVAGVVIGFSPTFFMALSIEGFGLAFVDSIHDLISAGSTNIELPVPWPWKADWRTIGWLLWSMKFSEGVYFIALVVVPVIAVLLLLRKPLAQFRPVDKLILCAAFAGIAYAHYAYSRADLTHLALSIVPVLLILLSAVMHSRMKILTCLVVSATSLLALAPHKPYLTRALLNKPLTTISVTGSEIHVLPGIDAYLRDVDQILDTTPGARQNFLAVPNAPTLHAIYRQKMPLWEIYALWPRSAEFEAKEVARLQKAAPRLVFMSNHALDQRPELRYSNTHPVVYAWITRHYIADPTPMAYQSWQVLRPKS